MKIKEKIKELLTPTKKYKVVINFEVKEGGNAMSMETLVNGRKSPMPPKLRKWIAEDYINQLMMRGIE